MLDFEIVYFGPLFLVFLTVQIPIDEVQDFIDAGVELKNNFVPFVSIADIVSTQSAWNILRQIAGNIILLMPFGFFIPLMLKMKLNWQKVLIIGFWVSFGIEAAQFGISHIIGYTYKITDVDDLILNTFGTMIGYGCYKVFEWGVKK